MPSVSMFTHERISSHGAATNTLYSTIESVTSCLQCGLQFFIPVCRCGMQVNADFNVWQGINEITRNPVNLTWFREPDSVCQ